MTGCLVLLQKTSPAVDASGPNVNNATSLLPAVKSGDSHAAETLLTLVYDELRRLAAYKMAHEAPGQTLQPTALVHEAWLRLVGSAEQGWNSRSHFISAAAEAMRRILIDNARRKRTQRHGGKLARADLADLDLPLPLPDEELLALDAALDRLTAFNARAAELVKLCYFVGLTQEQAARELGVSVSTAERLWAFARTFLYREIESDRNA